MTLCHVRPEYILKSIHQAGNWRFRILDPCQQRQPTHGTNSRDVPFRIGTEMTDTDEGRNTVAHGRRPLAPSVTHIAHEDNGSTRLRYSPLVREMFPQRNSCGGLRAAVKAPI